ncbi:hypothetical protein TA3x_004132 [Tundrisphaera sp. TA3]|uniref:hypothetical protein n=1 Tax=Tundrisphaera sp. TA3 TaxID=3435775 RepID=UPI003EBA0AD4
MSPMPVKDIFVVASILGLIVLGLAIVLGSGLETSSDRQHPWRRTIDTITQALLTLAGWGASLAAIQQFVGPRF